MALYKEKIAVFLVVVALSSSVLVAAARGTRDEGRGTKDEERVSSIQYQGSSSEYPESSTRELFFKMMFAVLLVVVLGVAAVYVSKKFLPKITNLSGKKIRVVETVHLGPRKTVHLLKIENRHLLIGSTTESITLLAEIRLTTENTEKSIINNQ